MENPENSRERSSALENALITIAICSGAVALVVGGHYILDKLSEYIPYNIAEALIP